MFKLHTYLKKGDIFIIFIIFFISISVFLFLFTNKSNTKVCLIKHNNDIVKTIHLDENTNDTVVIDDEYKTVISIENGNVFVEKSTCPNQVCVHTGKISNTYQSIACIPNKVLIEIIGNDDQEVDYIAK